MLGARIALCGLSLLILGALLWRLLGPDGVRMQLHDRMQEVDRMTRVVRDMREENNRLLRQDEDVNRDPAVLEARARSELGMIREGETFYVVSGQKRRSKAQSLSCTREAACRSPLPETGE